mmetsp:Transcript_86904/g.168329  ORF Transcript_86904/g.168329 Transcript_86904/m.168329 type:complete len:339 (+) Transcript_86904:3-1019(+)
MDTELEFKTFYESVAQDWGLALEATKERAQQMNNEICTRFDAERSELQVVIETQANEISDLKAEVAKMKMDRSGNKDTLEAIQDKLAVTFGAGASATKTKHLHTRIFLHWRAYSHRKAGKNKLSHIALTIHGHRLKGRVMNAWISYFTGCSRDKERQGSQALMKKTAEEIVKRYDNRIQTLESQLAAAQIEVVEGHRRRQHLEDELRRTLLKGINAMNLQALNIFQNAADVDSSKAQPFGVDCQPQTHYSYQHEEDHADPIQAAAGAAFNVRQRPQQQKTTQEFGATSTSSLNGSTGHFQPPQPRPDAPRPMSMAATAGGSNNVAGGGSNVERHVRKK